MAKLFHIDDAFSRMVDPQKTNLWTVDVEEPKCIENHRLWCAGSDFSTEFKSTLQFRASSITIPDRSVDTVTSKYLGHTYTFPLPSDSGQKSVDIEFVEREDQRVAIMLNSWIHEIYDHSQLENNWYAKYPDFKDSFTARITIRQYSLKGVELPTKIRIDGAFIKSLSSVKLDYGRSDAVRYTASFAFDYWALDGTENCLDSLKGD